MRRITIACALFCAAAGGCQGETGPAGKRGKDGTDGIDGQAGPQGPMGEQGLTGVPGLTGGAGPAGTAGPTGARGPEGARGPAGSPAATSSSVGGGSSYRPSSYVVCASTLDLLNGSMLGQDGNVDTFVSYTITRYSNADADVRCFAALGDKESPQFTAYYPSITTESMTADCDVTLDYPPYPTAGSRPGYWHFEIANGMPTATYLDEDPNHPLDGQGVTFAADNCNAYVMDLGGKWYTSALTDAL